MQVIPVDVRRSKTPLLVWNRLFGSCFCERDGEQRSIAFVPIILIFLTNKNSSLIYSVIICEQKNKGQCTVREFRMINSQLHCCFLSALMFAVFRNTRPSTDYALIISPL